MYDILSYPREDSDKHTRTLANGKWSSRTCLTFSALEYFLLCLLRCVTLTHIWLDIGGIEVIRTHIFLYQFKFNHLHPTDIRVIQRTVHHLRHPCIKVLIDERFDCLPTPPRVGAVLLTSTKLFPFFFFFFAQLGQCIQLYSHSCLPFHGFERNNCRGHSLRFCNPLASRQPYGYLAPRAATADAGAYRLPTGVTEQLFPRRSLPDLEICGFVAMACPLPTKSSDAESSELYTMDHQSISSRVCIFARLWAGIRRKRKNSRWKW